MNVNGKNYRTIWLHPKDLEVVQIIDQRWLPHKFVIEDIKTVEEMAIAIKDMHLRGAGLIGAAAGYGMYLAALEANYSKGLKFNDFITESAEKLKATRPTSVNLEHAVNRQLDLLTKMDSNFCSFEERVIRTYDLAMEIADEDAYFCRKIGENGVKIIENISNRKEGETVNILTHCNAGWLAFVDYGTATAPIYEAYNQGIKVHVWVDETRPRNQGAQLTAWELGMHGVPHTVITDNAGGHLMQHGLVDMVIVGTDRTTSTGDVANKIGTYLKALAAKDNNVPFYVALPSSSIDWKLKDGIKEIPIEERGSEEVKYIQGLHEGEIKKVLVTPEISKAANYGFDVTPSRLINALITERGVCAPTKKDILRLFPEHKNDN